jgi:membrane protein insertase Oxa1/YidC/SpoIIIJ
VFGLFTLPVLGAYHVVTAIASFSGVALAIIVFTVCVRLSLLPLSLAAARGGKARAQLPPRIQKLRTATATTRDGYQKKSPNYNGNPAFRCSPDACRRWRRSRSSP